MSNEISKMSERNKTFEPNSIFIPVDWSKIKNPPYVRTLIEREIQERNTVDADFEIIDNSNCVFDVNKIDDRLKDLGALEDIDCEIVPLKQIGDKK